MTFDLSAKRDAIKNKPFNLLNEEERKLRIKYLWGRLRTAFYITKFIRRTQD